MIVGGYTMDLYCDNDVEQPWYTKGHSKPGDYGTETYPDTYYAQTRAQCIKMARKAGWTFRRDGTLDKCPTCNKVK